MIGYYTKFTTSIENRGELATLLSQAAVAMRRIVECKLYEVALDVIDATSTVVTEVWADEAAHDASLQSEAAKELILQAAPLMAAPPKQIKSGPVITSWLD